MRGRMYDRPSYVPPFQVGTVLEGGAVGEVVASNDPGFAVGDLVLSMAGWREAFNAPASTLTKLARIPGVPDSAFLGILGMPGLTAWAGLTQIGEPKPGETVLVSGGAGAVGSAVAQIAKNLGCTVVATAGTDAKCQWLKAAGIDHAINYRTCGNLLEAVRAAAPKGIDVYFDNVGGEHLEVAIELARPFARLVECGMIAQYNATEPQPGPRNIIMVVGKSIRMQGFIVTQYAHLQPQFLAQMGGWIAEGKLRWEETIKEGIETAPEAFIGLFSGVNMGKMLVRL
jgi:NADPH-dependent curcumin reductase CurA